MDADPWITVLMPTYNGAPFIAAALDSVVAQGDAGIECIVVDDGSTDGTLKIVEGYSSRLSLIVRQHTRRGNWVKSTNEALHRARGKFVTMLHQDDVWLRGRIANLRIRVDRVPQASFYLGAAYFIDSRGRKVGIWHCPLPSQTRIVDQGLLMSRLVVQNFVALPAPMVRRELAIEVGGLDESLWYTADWDFWLKLAAAGASTYDGHPLVGFRLHDQSQTYTRSAALEEFRAQHSAIAKRHLEAWEFAEAARARIQRQAEFSIEANTALAGAVHGGSHRLWRLLAQFIALGPRNQCAYVKASRIVERIAARVRAGFI